MDAQHTLALVSQSFNLHGTIDVNIMPCDSTGTDEPDDEVLPDEPEDLLNQNIDFIVEISKAS